jgi:hypothetical protein
MQNMTCDWYKTLCSNIQEPRGGKAASNLENDGEVGTSGWVSPNTLHRFFFFKYELFYVLSATLQSISLTHISHQILCKQERHYLLNLSRLNFFGKPHLLWNI